MKKDLKAFLKTKRQDASSRPVRERVNDYRDVAVLRSYDDSQTQAYRCMDCGTPFCHWACPIGNYIPEWNGLLARGLVKEALELLCSANNFPEITGRLCPALCEYSCALGLSDDPITIRENELAVIEYGFEHNLIKPVIPVRRTDKKIAVIGSGPAGLAAAIQLNRAGHTVIVFEKDDKAGGMLRYGIPDFKLEKWIIDRRIDLCRSEGIEFNVNTCAGKDYPADKLVKEFDAVCLAIGSRVPRDLTVPGRDCEGIYFAMDYLTQSNRRVAGVEITETEMITAKDKKVVVIGGGDTGSDCVGTANRQGAACITQIEIMPQPPQCRSSEYPWPRYPLLLKTSSSHEEGVVRQWGILTKEFIAEEGKLKKISCVKGAMQKDSRGSWTFKETQGSRFEIEADMVFLALGFLCPQKQGLVEELHLQLDERGNIKTDNNYMTERRGIFTAGDSHRGQSLIAWAMTEGRQVARCIGCGIFS